jgi:endonuclease/exonuclease/phosphatase family metal-dependent hydrolase
MPIHFNHHWCLTAGLKRSFNYKIPVLLLMTIFPLIGNPYPVPGVDPWNLPTKHQNLHCAKLLTVRHTGPTISPFGFGPMKILQLAPTQERPEPHIRYLPMLTLTTINLGGLENINGLKRADCQRTPKGPSQQQSFARAISNMRPHIVFLQELESGEALQRFAREHLAGRFTPLFIRGNDRREAYFHTGFLIHRNLPLYIEHHSFRDFLLSGFNAPVFNHDLQVLVLYPQRPKKNTDRPFLILMGVYLRSHHPVYGAKLRRPDAGIQRNFQLLAIKEIFGLLTKRYGVNTPVMIMGDFNDDLARSQPLADLKMALQMEDVFDMGEVAHTGLSRVSQISWPVKAGPHQIFQLDAIWGGQWLKKLGVISSARVFHWTGADGTILPIPPRDQRWQMPSDHFPVSVELNVPPLWQVYRKYQIP